MSDQFNDEGSGRILLKASTSRARKERGLLLESFIDYLRSRGVNSTIIGISNLIRTRFRLIRFLWIVMLVGSIGFCVWQIIGIIMNFLAYEVVISIEYNSDPVTYMPGWGFSFELEVLIKHKLIY